MLPPRVDTPLDLDCGGRGIHPAQTSEGKGDEAVRSDDNDERPSDEPAEDAESVPGFGLELSVALSRPSHVV
jgi:hypothetical protein